MRTIGRILIGVGCGLLVASAASANGYGYGYGHRGGVDPALASLMKCYAQGTDAIGDASANPTTEEAIAAGVAIYNTCFKPDAKFYVWFPGVAWSSRIDPDPNVDPVMGTLAWAQFVAGAFRDGADPFSFTQHMTDVFRTRILSRGKRSRYGWGYTGKTAEVVAYLHANHVVTMESALVATGTYTLRAEWYKGKWMVTSLKLTLLNFDPFYQD